jgi:hypothetical protein
MKNNIIARVAFFLTAVMLFASCGKSYIEENEDAYKATDVVPIVFSASGPTQALQTFAYNFTVGYDRAGSTWTWTATDATVQSVSEDTKTASILFNVLPASDTALVMVSETTSAGVSSADKIMKVKVFPFCPLANGLADLVGSWSGTDGQGDFTYDVASSITTEVSGTKLKVSGVNVGFMGDFWGENIVSGGSFLMTVNPNGTLDIPQQSFCHTDWDSDYDIQGTGTWDNCGSTPTFKINYDVYYYDGDYWIAAHYGASYLDGKTYLTVDITLD